MTRAKRRLYLSHAWRRATWGMGQASGPVAVPARDPGRAHGRSATRARCSTIGTGLDLDLVFGSRRTSRFGTPVRAGGGAYRRAAGVRARPRPGRVSARRATSRRGARRSRGRPLGRASRWPRWSRGAPLAQARGVVPPRPIVPGRAPLPRRRPGPPRPLGGRHRREQQADPRRRGGHRRVQGRRRSAARRCSARSPTSSSSADRGSGPRGASSTSASSRRWRAPGWTRPRSTTSTAARGTRSPCVDNVEAWRRLRFLPRVLVDVRTVDPSVEASVDASRCRSRSRRWPPTSLSDPEGEVATARAAAAAGIPFAFSTSSARALEEVAPAAPNGDRWFQLYLVHDLAYTRSLAQRAAAAGYRVLVLTVDLPVLGYRERDRRCRLRAAGRSAVSPTRPPRRA